MTYHKNTSSESFIQTVVLQHMSLVLFSTTIHGISYMHQLQLWYISYYQSRVKKHSSGQSKRLQNLRFQMRDQSQVLIFSDLGFYLRAHIFRSHEICYFPQMECFLKSHVSYFFFNMYQCVSTFFPNLHVLLICNSSHILPISFILPLIVHSITSHHNYIFT